MKKTLSIILLVFVTNCVFSQISMPRIFGNNMILQRNKEIAIWGTAKPYTEISIELANCTKTTKSNEQGNWLVYLPSMKEAGPYTLNVSELKNGNQLQAITFKNIYIGDVWLASGQSNMEFKVKQGLNAQQEITYAHYPNIRFFVVPNTKQTEPQIDIPSGEWKQCDSTNVSEFSAAAYFFSRQIHTEQNVPIGIIQSTWGGTPVEAWTSKEMLMTVPELKKTIEKNIADSINQTTFDEDLRKAELYWNISQDSQNGIAASTFDYDDSHMATIEMPKVLQNWEIGKYEGVVWLRKEIDIPKSFSTSNITINLGYPEMMYNLYFNGNLICEKRWNAQKNHTYTIPKSMLRTGKNVIALRMAFLWGGGGFSQSADSMYISNGEKKISVAGTWKYVLNLEPTLPKVYNYQNFPTYVYNAMINPLIPYSLCGFLWYQGEANVDNATLYQTLFPLMITDWRKRFKQADLPFVYVQLANFMAQMPVPSESRWAELREAQSMTQSMTNVAMVSAIDIGEADDIHPKNKQEVGRRLALAATNIAYGKETEYSGPQLDSFNIEGNTIRLYYSHLGTGLTTNNGKSPIGFAIAGANRKFVWADAIIENNTIVVQSSKVLAPLYVRYAWANNPECNVCNQEGLPAVPFRTDKGTQLFSEE